MNQATLKITIGFVVVAVVTLLAVGVVATSAAISHEVTDGDGCETSGQSHPPTTASPTEVVSYAGTLTECVAPSDDAPSPPSASPSEN